MWRVTKTVSVGMTDPGRRRCGGRVRGVAAADASDGSAARSSAWRRSVAPRGREHTGGVTTVRDALVQHGADGGERAWPVDRRTPPRRAPTVCGEPTTDHHVGPTALDDPRRPLAALDDEPAPGRQPAGR